ncbi:MAG: HNH endonuclease [Bradyrhizobiaceae bacterium]|nr:HNH endonuclease [Bradyrhizobiaceae bacterium]
MLDIRRVAELVQTSIVTMAAYAQHGKYHPATFQRRFGSWNKAVVAAGLQVAAEQNYDDERLFANMMRVWEHYGRQPRLSELARPPSVISGDTYKRRFHSWTRALQHFVDYANSLDKVPPAASELAKGDQPRRKASLRLRFRILKRDNFSCRACGASPAFKPGLNLHIDHIKPWSLGGETTEDNLQTLCDACNLGKSNVL